MGALTHVLLQVLEDPKAGIAWTSGEGQLYCVSKGFMSLLGYSFHDLRRNIQAIGMALDCSCVIALTPSLLCDVADKCAHTVITCRCQRRA